MKKNTLIIIGLSLSVITGCASKKHSKCDAYGNKSGDVKTENVKRA